MRELAAATTAGVAAAPAPLLLVLPVGSTEQHGPHLPLGTDTLVAVELARRLVARRGDAVLAPAIPYGASGEHEGFAGTVSVGQEALELVLVELGRSASASFPAIAVVSGHGGNREALGRAARRLVAEGRRVACFAPSFPGDAHAGRTETSLLLALAPWLVHTEAAEAGAVEPLAELFGALRAGGVAAVSKNGVLGDPAGASAAEGEILLAGALDALEAELEAWLPVPPETAP
jgi:creatinine amidohydrolase